jgi:hypothetical protein
VKFSKELKAGVIALLAIVGFVVLFQFMKGKAFLLPIIYFTQNMIM